MTTENEQIIIARARQGEEEAFTLLVNKYGPRLQQVVLAMVRNPYDAEDIVQEAFLTALQRLETFKGDSSFGTWLYRIAYNRTIDTLRRQREVTVETVYSSSREEPSDFGQLDSKAEISKALEVLSPEQLGVVFLRHYQDYSLREIAATLNVPIGTVKSRLYYAYSRLQAELSKIREAEQKWST